MSKFTKEELDAKIGSLSDFSIHVAIRETTRQELMDDGYLCFQCTKVFATSRVYLPGQCGAKCTPVCEPCREKIREEAERAGGELTPTGFIVIPSRSK